MIKIDIRVEKNSVLEGVTALSAYVARSMGNDRVAFTESDTAAGEQLWLEAVSELTRAMQEWLRAKGGFAAVRSPYVGGDLVGELTLPENWDEAETEALVACMHRYLVQEMMCKWLVLYGADRAQVYAEGAAAAMNDIQSLLTVRQRPEGCMVSRWGRRGNTAMIVLDRGELLRDIRHRGWVLADLTESAAADARHQTADVASGSNMEIVERELDLVWHELENVFYPFLPSTVGYGRCGHFGGVDFGVVDDAQPRVERYELQLDLPDGVTESSVRYWRTLMHDYMVTKALAAWTGMVNPDKQPALLLRGADLRERLSVSLSCRARRVRRPCRPW